MPADNDNGAIDRLKSDCRALAGAWKSCDPQVIRVVVEAAPSPRAFAERGLLTLAVGRGDTTEAALADLRRVIRDACADRVTVLVAEARALDEEAARSRRTAAALSRVVSAAREGAPRG